MAHIISDQDQWFLKMGRRDPLQLSEFKLGDRVVVCKKCRCVQTFDSWEFNMNTCVLCGNDASSDDFSREYIDLAYHREDKAKQTIIGFNVVETDKEYKDDWIRKWFSQKRISRTYTERLWLNIFLLLLVVGLFFYLGHDALDYYMTAMISPLISKVIEKLNYINYRDLPVITAVSRMDLSTKFSTLGFKIDILMNKVSFIRGKLLLLGTGGLYIGRKAISSLAKIDWSDKKRTIVTNFQLLMNHFTLFFQR